MINVTQNAARQLRSLLEEQPRSRGGKGLRVQIGKGGCSGLHYEMALDEKKAGDEVVEQDGVEFFIDDKSAEHLRGATVDFGDGLTVVGFHMVNPDGLGTCGCGSCVDTAGPALNRLISSLSG